MINCYHTRHFFCGMSEVVITFSPNEPFYHNVEFDRSNENYIQISAFCCSYNPTCPKHKQSTCPQYTYGPADKDGTKTLEVFDIYKLKPALVKLTIQKWKCKCGHKFDDPNSPYFGKNRTDPDFDNYMAQEMLSHSEMTNGIVAKKYGLDASTVSKKVKNYIASLKDITYPKPFCQTIWAVPIHYRLLDKKEIKLYLLFGKIRKSSIVPSGTCTLLDVIHDIDYTHIFSYITYENTEFFRTSNDTSFHPKVIGPEFLRKPTEQMGFQFCRLQDNERKGERPKEIDRVKNVIKRFAEHNVPLEGLKNRLIFQSDLRRERLRQLGVGEYLGKEASLLTFEILQKKSLILQPDNPYSTDVMTYHAIFDSYRKDTESFETYIDLNKVLEMYEDENLFMEKF